MAILVEFPHLFC